MSFALWLADVPGVAVQVALLACVVVAIERWLLPPVASPVREALWGLLLLRCLVPARWFELPIDLPWAAAPTPLHADGAAWSWLVAWGLGSALFAWAGCRRYRRRVAALHAGAAPVAASWRRAGRDAAALLGLRAVPTLCATHDGAAPCLVGLWRPVLFVPAASAEALDPQQRLHIALHELAHLRRRDAWRAAAVLTLQVAFFWHPFVWLAARRLRTARELGADAVAVAAVGEAVPYGRTLLACAKPHRPSVPAPAASMTGGELQRRIAALVQPRRSPGRQLLAVALVLVVACLTAAAAAAPRPPGCLLLRYQVLGALADLPSAAR